MKVEIELLSAGPVSVAARAWSHRGRGRLTAIVKASFRLAQDRPLELAAPTPVVARESARSDNPLASTRRSLETALYVRRPEILLDAIACSPNGSQVEQMKVRLALARGPRMLLSKELLVVGDRTSVGGESPRPLPFNRMPVVYERAFGGLGHAHNPAGVGVESGGRVTMPNVLAGEGARVEPFGYGPISTGWPHRRARRGAVPRADIDEALSLELPDNFDDGYFQSAPLDQQLDDIAAGDMLVMIGLHPEHPTLRVAIPTLRGAAIAETASRRRVPIAMRLDTVFVEPHLMRADLVFRGVVELGVQELAGVRVAGALEEPSSPFTFPDLATLRGSAHGVSSPGGGAKPDRQGRAPDATMLLEPESAPRQSPPQKAPPANLGGTMVLDQPAAPARLPVPPAPPPPPATPAPPNATLLMVDSTNDAAADAPAPSLPFLRGKRRRSSMRMAAVNRPPAAPPPVAANVRPASAAINSTIAIEPEPIFSFATKVEPLPPPPAPPPPPLGAPPPATPPIAARPDAQPPPSAAKDAAHAPEPKKPPESPWAQQPAPAEPPKPKAPAAPRPMVQPAPNLKAQFYKKFKP